MIFTLSSNTQTIYTSEHLAAQMIIVFNGNAEWI